MRTMSIILFSNGTNSLKYIFKYDFAPVCKASNSKRGSPQAANISIWQQPGSLKFTVCGGGFQ